MGKASGRRAFLRIVVGLMISALSGYAWLKYLSPYYWRHYEYQMGEAAIMNKVVGPLFTLPILVAAFLLGFFLTLGIQSILDRGN